jgi:hypothetical protein
VVRALGAPGAGERIDLYDPRQIREMLSGAGFTFDSPQHNLPFKPAPVDARLPIFEKAIHSFQPFQRSTQVSAGTFRLRLSLNANRFFEEIFPDMRRAGILEEITHGASGRYRLAVPMSVIASALAQSQGSYDKCLEIIKLRHAQR